MKRLSVLLGAFVLLACALVGCGTDVAPADGATGVQRQAQDNGTDTRSPVEVCRDTCYGIHGACLLGPCDSNCEFLCDQYLGSCIKECEAEAKRPGLEGAPTVEPIPGTIQK